MLKLPKSFRGGSFWYLALQSGSLFVTTLTECTRHKALVAALVTVCINCVNRGQLKTTPSNGLCLVFGVFLEV